jgi:hypothetical protein
VHRIFNKHNREDIAVAAMERIPPEHKEAFQNALRRPKRVRADIAARQKERSNYDRWEHLLQQRVVIREPLQPAQQNKHRSSCEQDIRRIAQKIGPAVQALAAGDDS